MGITRSQAQWKTIFEEQETSGLTIIDYCREHQLSTSSFYAIRKKSDITQSNFVRVKITQQVELVSPQYAQHWQLVRFEIRQNFIVKHIGSGNWCFSNIELGKSYFSIGIYKGCW